MAQKDKYNCIVIDDEPIAIKVIKEHIERFEQLNYEMGFTNALEAIEILNAKKIDLLFLDINMPGISGIEFLRSLTHPPKVIFTTAYRNFAVDAFDLDAIDYLVKPISFERFLKAINKFIAHTNQATNEVENKELEKDYIILKADKKNYKISFEDIIYIESLDNYIKVYTNDFSIICYESLSSIEKQMPNSLIRIHRSHIINLKKVDIFTSSTIEIGERKFTIGRNYKEDVLKKLNQ